LLNFQRNTGVYARIFCMILYHFFCLFTWCFYSAVLRNASAIYIMHLRGFCRIVNTKLFLFVLYLCFVFSEKVKSLPQRPLCCFKLPVSQVNPGFHWFCLKRVHECLHARTMLHHYIFLLSLLWFYFLFVCIPLNLNNDIRFKFSFLLLLNSFLFLVFEIPYTLYSYSLSLGKYIFCRFISNRSHVAGASGSEVCLLCDRIIYCNWFFVYSYFREIWLLPS